MKKIVTLLLLLSILISFNRCENNKYSTEKNVQQLSWLNGDWVMQGDDGIITEHWKKINDSLMEGSSDFVKMDSIIPFEKIKIYVKDTSLYYEAKAAGENNERPVAFQLISFSDTGFVAENLLHDFPKRIIYRLINRDSIHAYVDGGLAMPEKRSDFYYSRTKK